MDIFLHLDKKSDNHLTAEELNEFEAILNDNQQELKNIVRAKSYIDVWKKTSTKG